MGCVIALGADLAQQYAVKFLRRYTALNFDGSHFAAYRICYACSIIIALHLFIVFPDS